MTMTTVRFLFLLLGFSISSLELTANGRPNILFCISDDQSYAHTGANGDPVVKTPAFDRIAKEGLRTVLTCAVLIQHYYQHMMEVRSCSATCLEILLREISLRLASMICTSSRPELLFASLASLVHTVALRLIY